MKVSIHQSEKITDIAGLKLHLLGLEHEKNQLVASNKELKDALSRALEECQRLKIECSNTQNLLDLIKSNMDLNEEIGMLFFFFFFFVLFVCLFRLPWCHIRKCSKVLT